MYNLLFCAHTLWLNYVTDMFLLVSYSGGTQNLFVHGQGQKSEQKHGTKNFAGLYFSLSNLASQ